MAALTGALLALSAAGTASGFFGQRRAGKAAQQQGDYQGAILDQNAGVADQQAADAIVRGAEAEGRSRAGTSQLTGSQRAAMAAQGIDLNSGSAADVQSNDQALGDLDALAIRRNARREAWGFKTQAANDRAQANLARMGGAGAAASANNASVGTLMSGALDLYKTYDAFKIAKSPSKPSTSSGPSASNGGYHNGTASR